MYSSHDTQVGVLWEWLNFTSFQFDSIPYASFLQMELYEDKNCSAQSDPTKCFSVLFNANGKDLKYDIDGCRNKSMCPYPLVRQYLQKISYNQEGFTKKIKQLCDTPFKSPEGSKPITKRDRMHKKLKDKKKIKVLQENSPVPQSSKPQKVDKKTEKKI